jgi:hypothetical protein
MKFNFQIKSIIVLALIFFCNSVFPQTVPLSPELNKKLATADLLNDLDFILQKVNEKEYNRSPFNFFPEQDFKERVKSIKAYFAANDSLTRVDFFKKVGPLLTLLKDDHSSLELGHTWVTATLQGKLSEERFVIPLSLLVYDGSCYAAASETIPVKSKIVTINGIPVMDIVRETLRHVNFSEYNAVNNNILASFDFPKYAVDLWALYNFTNQVEVTYIPYGKDAEQKVSIPLYSYLDRTMFKNWKTMPVKMDKNPSLEFKNEVAILRLPSFRLGTNRAEDLRKWLELFMKYFDNINSAKSKKLLIDISNNGGGSESVGYLLLNFLYDGKLKSSLYSNEFTPFEFFKQNIAPVINDPSIEKVKFNVFGGEKYLLISEMTFSSAARFADLFKTFSIGKILGRETRGFRTHYGEAKSYDLEKTGLRLTISSNFFVSASGDMKPHGVLPDYEIKINNVDDLFARFGNDYYLKEALKYLSKEN